MEGLIQLQTEQLVLTYLLAASVNENNSFITQSVLQKALSDLKIFIENKKKIATDGLYSGHLLLALERMKKPENAKPTTTCRYTTGCADRVRGMISHELHEWTRIERNVWPQINTDAHK